MVYGQQDHVLPWRWLQRTPGGLEKNIALTFQMYVLLDVQDNGQGTFKTKINFLLRKLQA